MFVVSRLFPEPFITVWSGKSPFFAPVSRQRFSPPKAPIRVRLGAADPSRAIAADRRCGRPAYAPPAPQGKGGAVGTPCRFARIAAPRASRRASRINVSQADGVAAIRIDIAAGSVYLRSCPSGTQSTSAPPLDFSKMGIIPPGLKRVLGASHAIRSGGQPCSPRARRSRRGPARS